MTPEAREWLGGPALTRLWDRLRERLERNGLAALGRLRLDDPTDAEREALSLLLGRACSSGAITIGLTDLDERLRSGAAGCGLVDTVTALRGTLTDRRAARDSRLAAREHVWAAANDALEAAGLDGVTWARPWLDEIRRGGALGRLDPGFAANLLKQAIHVLARLNPRTDALAGGVRPHASEGETLARGVLAERVTGTAHGLDDDTLLARFVLRALARARGVEPPRDARARRELWEVAGVATDRVSSTVLTHGLAPLGDEWPARLLRERANASAETHLTMRDVHRTRWRLPPRTEIFVCENPRVVEAAGEARCRRPLVCTSGNPTTVVLALLEALTAAGARLAYRGDFDWPGIAMANRMIGRYDARPWRMGAVDYEEHTCAARDRGTPLQPLSGVPIDAAWDPELTPAMRSLGVAVQEESALEQILTDLIGA